MSALRHSPTAKKPASQKDGDETAGQLMLLNHKSYHYIMLYLL